MSVSERLKEFVFFSKKSATQLSKELGVTQSAFNKAIKGDVMPSSKILIPLAQIGVNINWLLLGEGDMMREIEDTHNVAGDNNTIISNSKLNNSNNRNTNTAPKKEKKAKLEKLQHEIETLKIKNQALEETNQALKESKAVLENQIKDKEMIISLLQNK